MRGLLSGSVGHMHPVGRQACVTFNVGQEVEFHFASSQWNCFGAKDVMGVTEMVWVMEKVGLDIDSWLSLNSE